MGDHVNRALEHQEKCRDLCSYISFHSLAFAQLGITTLWLQGSLTGEYMGLSHSRRLGHTATRARGVKQKKHWYLLVFNSPIYTKERTILWLPFCHMLQTSSTYSKKQSKVQHALAHKHHGDISLSQHHTRTISFSTVLHWHGFQFQCLINFDNPGISKLGS